MDTPVTAPVPASLPKPLRYVLALAFVVVLAIGANVIDEVVRRRTASGKSISVRVADFLAPLGGAS